MVGCALYGLDMEQCLVLHQLECENHALVRQYLPGYLNVRKEVQQGLRNLLRVTRAQ